MSALTCVDISHSCSARCQRTSRSQRRADSSGPVCGLPLASLLGTLMTLKVRTRPLGTQGPCSTVQDMAGLRWRAGRQTEAAAAGRQRWHEHRFRPSAACSATLARRSAGSHLVAATVGRTILVGVTDHIGCLSGWHEPHRVIRQQHLGALGSSPNHSAHNVGALLDRRRGKGSRRCGRGGGRRRRYWRPTQPAPPLRRHFRCCCWW